MKKRVTLLISITAVFALFLLGAYLNFNRSFKLHMQEITEDRLQEISSPSIASFELQVKEQIRKVKTLADALAVTGDLGNSAHREMLLSSVEHSGLLRCAIAFPDGTFITHDQKSGDNVSNDPWFIANMNGEFYITDPRPAVVDSSKTVILFTCPIKKDERIIGSVIYSYLCDDMDSIFNLRFLDGQGQMLVTKENGDTLIGKAELIPQGENLIKYLQSVCSHKKHKPEECISLTTGDGSHTITPKGGATPLLVHYAPLNINDWYMISMAPENAATHSVSSIAEDQRKLGITIAICSGIYISVLAFLWILQRNNIDHLTGLVTLEHFKRSAKKILRNNKDKSYVFVKLDVKNFKLINRVYDFSIGNQVIKNIANALQNVLNESDSTCTRIGTDNFVFLFPYYGEAAQSEKRAQFIQEFKRLMGSDFTTVVDFPTGQYILPDEERRRPDINEILEKVNFAHRAAKQKNWGGIIVDYAENLEKQALLEKAIEDKMSSALTNEEFTLYLQPKFLVSDETICGAEALVRWEVGGEFFMHPTAFIPTLERNGFIVKIDMYMFEQAVIKIRSILDNGQKAITISVNFSRVNLSNERFVEELCEITDRYQVPRKYLEIELTESAVFDNLEQISQLLCKLHEAGFSMSMDDFGSGYSCLALLKDLDFDVLKIDKCFFDPSEDPQRAKTVISSIIKMAKDLKLITVAEGIETKDQVTLLRELNCDIIQGFYFSKPIPGSQLELPPANS